MVWNFAAGVGWTSGTTITERFPTLEAAMVISKFSLSPRTFIFCSKSKFGAILWRREKNWTLSDLLLSNWSHVMLLLSLEFHFRALRNVHTDPVSEPNFLCLSRDAFSRKENPLLTLCRLLSQSDKSIENVPVFIDRLLLLNHFRYMMNYKLQNGQRRGLWRVFEETLTRKKQKTWNGSQPTTWRW